MVSDYEDNDKFHALASVIEDYTEWFAQIALYVAYSGEEHIPENFSMPRSFTDWLENNDSDAEISPAAIQPITDIHNAMKGVVADLMIDLAKNQRPRHQSFIEFKNLYSSFLSSVRRLEKDSTMKSDGTDELTGLRPISALKHDLDREMQRLSRNGNPFSLMIARIDGFVDFDNQRDAVSTTVKNIKKCMRPFDDAYYLNDGNFLLSLKHADLVGAEAAILRIQNSLEHDEANANKITLSCCMSEPVDGDEVSNLLKNMRDDLEAHADDYGAVLKLLDISPLERFVELSK